MENVNSQSSNENEILEKYILRGYKNEFYMDVGSRQGIALNVHLHIDHHLTIALTLAAVALALAMIVGILGLIIVIGRGCLKCSRDE
jgi:hypothetical protein